MTSGELRDWRQRCGWSQGQLARVLGVIPLSVSRWERSDRPIPSFLHLALAYLESKGDELKPRMRGKKRKEV
jgi:transcriptional regulator with XRE-family HTH domain